MGAENQQNYRCTQKSPSRASLWLQSSTVQFAVCVLRFRIWLVAFLLALAPALSTAQDTAARLLEYHLRLTHPSAHLVDVEIDAREVRQSSLDFVLPVWSPGRYAIYHFAKNVQEFSASGAGNQPLDWSQPDLDTWRVDSRRSGGTVRVRYRVFANDLSGSFSQFDTSHANLNGASVFMYVDGHKADPVALTIDPPAGWKIYSGLSNSPSQATLQAANYDRLIDAPIEVSPGCTVTEFHAADKIFRVVVHAYEGGGWAVELPGTGEQGPGQPVAKADGEYTARLVEGLQKIVRSEMAMMPAPDFDTYTFLIHFAPLNPAGADGMEHLNSTQIIVPASPASGTSEAIESAAHEFFHVWNVKRLRPAALGPFDYTRENYTPSLWFAEGVTQYYSYLHLLRAGTWARQEFLQRLAQEIAGFEREPGRKLMSAESSSFHAWFYDRSPQMQETNFANATISYYNKGALLGMLLDLELRARTQGRKSLDDVLRLMYERFYSQVPAATYYLPGHGYEEQDILETASAVAGSSLRDFFDRYVRGTDPLPYEEVLAKAGLQLSIGTQKGDPPSLGILTQPVDTGVKIAAVRPGGAADRAGLSRDDVLVAVDELEVASTPLEDRLRMYPVGAKVPVTIERHSQRLRIMVKLDPPEPSRYTIEPRSDATSVQVAIRHGWLGE